jgi:hypothetical protein
VFTLPTLKILNVAGKPVHVVHLRERKIPGEVCANETDLDYVNVEIPHGRLDLAEIKQFSQAA